MKIKTASKVNRSTRTNRSRKPLNGPMAGAWQEPNPKQKLPLKRVMPGSGSHQNSSLETEHSEENEQQNRGENGNEHGTDASEPAREEEKHSALPPTLPR